MGAFNFNKQPNNEKIDKPFDFGMESNTENKADITTPEDDVVYVDEQEDDYEYTTTEDIRAHSNRAIKPPLILEEYPDSYPFRTGDLARFLGIKEQNVRNFMKLYLDKYIQPETDSKGRIYTKEQMIKIEEIYNTWYICGFSWPDIEKMLASEMGAVHIAKDNIAAGEELAELIKVWLNEAIQNHSPTMALEDKQMLEALNEKLEASEKTINELKDEVNLQRLAMKTQTETFQNILEGQSAAAKEQKELLIQLQETNKQLKEQNDLLIQQTKKKKFLFFK